MAGVTGVEHTSSNWQKITFDPPFHKIPKLVYGICKYGKSSCHFDFFLFLAKSVSQDLIKLLNMLRGGKHFKAQKVWKILYWVC